MRKGESYPGLDLNLRFPAPNHPGYKQPSVLVRSAKWANIKKGLVHGPQCRCPSYGGCHNTVCRYYYVDSLGLL